MNLSLEFTKHFSYFLAWSPLQKHVTSFVEQEHAKGTVQQDIPIRAHCMALPLGGSASQVVLLIY